MRSHDTTRRARARRAVALVAVLAAGCGGGGKKATTTAGGAATTKPGASATSAVRGGGNDLTAPVDACALLTAAEVAPFVPNGQGRSEGAPGACHWEDPGFVPSGGNLAPPTLDVRVQTGAVAMAEQATGHGLDYLRSTLQAEAKDLNGRMVDGIGDAAVVTSALDSRAEVKAVLRGALLVVDFSAVGARQRMDEVVGLARAVAGRLAKA